MAMAKNAGGESRIPVSRAVRPSYLSKPKILGLSKHLPLTSATSQHRRSNILSGCHLMNESAEEFHSTTPKQWPPPSLLSTSTPVDNKGNLADTNFSPAVLWNCRDNEIQHELTLQRKEDKYFGKLYGQVNMSEDVGDSCLMESTLAFSETSSNSLNASTQYLMFNKQNSFEHDESLGILTPDQMTDFTVALNCSRTPSCENLTPGSRLAAGATSSSSSRASRPTDIPFADMEASGSMCERSPSLEELPLDSNQSETKLLPELPVNSPPRAISTVPAVAPGTTAASTALPMSFVTSVTSITSLEAGYQGDGENSRPASRGPDPPSAANLPGNLTASCQACRLHDPMTDSDFFTESDADAHEDIGRGDRKAQVIDGTLFCAPGGRRCPSFAGEEMDSSGIYSDLDKRPDERFNLEEARSEEQSPDTADTADTAETQMSQRCLISPTVMPETPQVIMDFMQVPNSPTDVSPIVTPEKHQVTVIHVGSESTTSRSVVTKSESAALKKYKMPKKNVASKIKAMIESVGNKEETLKEPRRPTRQPRKNGRWDAVMSKIEAGKTEQRSRPPRTEVKSRLMQGLAPTTPSSHSSASSSSAVTVASTKQQIGDANNNADKDKRRSRVRQDVSSPMQETARSSVRSSMSDLSSAASKSTGSKRSPAIVNQQRRAINGRNSLKSRTANNDTKKACTLDLSPLNLDKSPTPIRSIKKQNGSTATLKDRTVKEFSSIAATSPRNTIQTRDQSAQTDTSTRELTEIKFAEDKVQALCLTIQYLTRQQEEFLIAGQAKQQELMLARTNLEEKLDDERKSHEKAIDELKTRLEASYEERVSQLENVLQQEKDDFESRLKASHENQLKEHAAVMERLKSEHTLEIQAKEAYWNGKKTSADTEKELAIVRDEYETIKLAFKPVIALKNRVIAKLKSENDGLRRKIDDNEKLKGRIDELEAELKIKSRELAAATYETETIDCSALGNDQIATLRAEIWSLRSVLEIRSQENASLRSENDVLRRDVESKVALEQRVEALEARCEDLKAQLQSKDSFERQLSHQNEILLGSFDEINKHNKRLTQRNEELQWRLRQKNEVVSVLANQLAVPNPRLSRSLGPEHIDHSIVADNSQPNSSSMIKFMVHKGDSVSWTLEIDESSDPLPSSDSPPTISRQNSLRRTPRKSLDIRARSKSISASDGLISDSVWSPSFNSTPVPRRRPRSDPANSGIATSGDSNQGNNTGPRPQEAGGEAMISEEASATSSEDESSASSGMSRMTMDFAWTNAVE